MSLCLILSKRLRWIIRGVFKKRPNFLNRAPTNIESTLRLMSAPSVRFWQQAAICPVSLWTLVFELHPLNWTRAQAVHRIIVRVPPSPHKKGAWRTTCVCVCVCVKFCCEFGKHFTETFKLLNQAYREDCMNRTHCYEWFKRFKEGRM